MGFFRMLENFIAITSVLLNPNKDLKLFAASNINKKNNEF